MKRALVFFILIAHCCWCPAQKKVVNDSGYIAPRVFSTKQLEEYKKDTDFQYDRYTKPAPSLWTRFWNWFWWKVQKLMSTDSGRITIWSLLVMISVAIILYFILKMTGADKGGLFGRKSAGYATEGFSENDIYSISFDVAINKAIADENYRLAIRLHYLQALKILSDKGMIGWKLNKTNSDYLLELQGKALYDPFRKLTYNFEYTWYGEKNVERALFDEVSNQFQQFNKQVQ